MSSTEMVLSYLRVLIWPALVLALGVAYRSTIRNLLKVRLTQIDGAGFSAKFEKVAQDAERVVEEDPRQPAPALRKLKRRDIVKISPKTYDEARTVGEAFREGKPVFLDLTQMTDYDAKRLVDFAAGLIFSAHGSIDRVTNRQFLLIPYGISLD